MSYIRVWIHAVWSTKGRRPFLTGKTKKVVIEHILENAAEKGIHITCIDGHKDHLHALISLGKDQSVAKVMRLIKGESSNWVNKQGLTRTKFEWANEYFAVSVGESQVQRVRNYIRDQENHHRVKTWQEEYDELMQKYGFARLKG